MAVNPLFRVTLSKVQVPLVGQVRVLSTGFSRLNRVNVEVDPELSPEALPHECAIRDLAPLDLDDFDAVVAFIESTGYPESDWQAHSLGPHAVSCDLTALRDVQRAARHVIGPDTYADPWAGFLEGRSLATDEAYDRSDWWHASELDEGDRNLVLVLNSYLHLGVPAILPGDVSTVVRASPVALSAQLFNLLAARSTIRRCENERCEKDFVTQLGRSGKGSRRQGVKYCTNACARAQAERMRRRRAKQS